MKLNFVLEISSIKNGNHFAFAVQEHTSNNLYHAFDKYHNYNKGYEVVCVQFVESRKKAEALARNWNDCFKRNGTLMTSEDFN